MAEYRLYFLGPSGRILRREEIEAHDDAQAIGKAERKSDGGGTELWLGSRKVKSFTPAK